MNVGFLNFSAIPPETQKIIDDNPLVFKNVDLKSGYEECFRRRVEAVMCDREEVLNAFIAKYGFEPDRFCQVEQKMPDGSIHWYVKRMTDEEMKSRSLTCSEL